MAEQEQMTFEFEQRKTIKGYPELHWTGKRPYKSTQYFPAQLKETYGTAKPFSDKDGETSNWINKIFWGDNLQVMSHMLKEYRGKIDLIYIDPPFDSKADYKKKIKLKGKTITNDNNSFEEKQYGDIWTNDEYLQFMYERLILLRELLTDNGSIYLHCDYKRVQFLRIIMDELFGAENCCNEIIWYYEKWTAPSTSSFQKNHDDILFYSKRNNKFNIIKEITPNLKEKYEKGYLFGGGGGAEGLVVYDKNNLKVKELISSGKYKVVYVEPDGKPLADVWKIPFINPVANERTDYPTQKPESLIERIIKASSNPGDLVFDCFMGSGTTQAVSMKLGRRFIGADINLGAIQTTTKRLINIANDLNSKIGNEDKFTSFEVYNVNNYDFFRNPIEARDLLIQALEINAFASSSVFDGEKDGRMVKILPVNRIATKADLQELIANLPYKTFERKKEENPNQHVERITLVCMGHEADLKASLEQSLSNYKVDVDVVDILRDKAELQFKREAEVEVERVGQEIVIKNFYPLNLMQKLSMQKDTVEDWRQLVESIMIDFNYDGAVLEPTVIDLPDKNQLVKGRYSEPQDSGKIKIKITDLLSESLEVEV